MCSKPQAIIEFNHKLEKLALKNETEEIQLKTKAIEYKMYFQVGT